MKKDFSLLKLYLVIVSIVSIIGLAIGYGIAIYQYVSGVVISDDEYLLGSYNSYERQDCDQPVFRTEPVPGREVKRTAAEKETCKKEAKERILTRRSFERKNDIIQGGVRGMLFTILLLFHLPALIRKTNADQ